MEIKKPRKSKYPIEKRISDAASVGVEYVGEVFMENGLRSQKYLYRLQCGHLKEIKPCHLRDNRFVCTECRLSREEYLKEYRKNHKEEIDKKNKEWNLANSDYVKQRRKEHYIRNKARLRAMGKQHYLDNKSTYLAYSKYRKALIKNRAPRWLSKEQLDNISNIYKECKFISDSTGIPHHVDHIVPLMGEAVSGLHVPWNLRIIPAQENLSKSNSFDESILEELGEYYE